MDDSKNILPPARMKEGSNPVVPTNVPRSSTQQLLKSLHRGFQDILLMLIKHFNIAGHAVLLATDDNPTNNPVITAQEKTLQEKHQELLGSVRRFLTIMVNVAGAEIAIVVLFQIMHNKREGGRDGVRAAEAEMETEVEEVDQEGKTTSMFEVICAAYGKDTAMDIVNDMLNTTTLNITTALVLATTQYVKGKVQRECVYYVLRKQHELMQTYRKLMETMIRGNDRSIEIGLIAIFMTMVLPNKEDNNNSTTTLFQTACQQLGRKIVVEIIEDILQQQQRAASSSSLSSRSSMNTMLALVFAAEINDAYNNDQTHSSVHVDGFYFLLRRQPDVLLRCNSNSSIHTSASNSSANPSEAEDAAARNSSHNVVDDECTTSSRKIRKRKRTVKWRLK